MLLIVASVSEASDKKGKFKLFDIAVDGEYFCSFRYSQLHQFYTQLKKAFPSVVLPNFPPKMLGTPSVPQLEQRRIGIETYLQKVVNTPQISGSPLFKNFFLSAQFASWNGTANPITLTVHLLGGETVSLSEVSALEREELVKENFVKKLGLCSRLGRYFALHIAYQDVDGSLLILRQLYNMESPVITLYRGGPKRRLVFARKFWHLSIHKEVYESEAGRDVLFSEAVQAVEKGLWKCREEDKEAVKIASKEKNKQEFLDLMVKQDDYLSTVVRGLTVELASGRYDGFVTIRREALRVAYRAGGGEGGAGPGYKDFGIDWSRIMSWNLLHLEGLPVLHLIYNCQEPLQGQCLIILSGGPVVYLSQCLEQAVIVMAMGLTEAVDHKKLPVDEVPNFPKVTRAATVWSVASGAPTQTPPGARRGQQQQQLLQGGPQQRQQWQQQQQQQQQWQQQQQQQQWQRHQQHWQGHPQLQQQQQPQQLLRQPQQQRWQQQQQPQQGGQWQLQQQQWQQQQRQQYLLSAQPPHEAQQQQQPPPQQPPPQQLLTRQLPLQEPPPQQPPPHEAQQQQPPPQQLPPQQLLPRQLPLQEPPPQEPPPQEPPPQEPPPQEPPLQEPPPQEPPSQEPPLQEPPPQEPPLQEPPPQEPLPQEPSLQEPPPQEPPLQEPPLQEPPPQEPPLQEPPLQEPPPQEPPPREPPPQEPPLQEPPPQEPPLQEPPPQEPPPQEPPLQEPPPQEPPLQEPPLQEPPPQEPPPQEPPPQEPPPQEPPPQEPLPQEPPLQEAQREEHSWVASTSSRKQRTQSL